MRARSSEIFAKHALALVRRGLAVLPAGGADGKTPMVSGWNKWRRPPTARTMEKFAQQHPCANIAVITGLSNVFVVDVDRADQSDDVENLFGKTPLRSKTSRGMHLWYRAPRQPFKVPANLKAHGFDADLKHGNSIVLVPPSRHGSGATYQLLQSSWDALKGLEEPNLEWLNSSWDTSQRLSNEHSWRDYRNVLVGQRGLSLNNILCAHVGHCADFDELLDKASSVNDDFEQPLGENEVIKRARAVWKDFEAGKLEAWIGRTTGRGDADLMLLCNTDVRHGPDAFALLTLLKANHSARYRRNETFAISTRAMARESCIPGWGYQRYAAARNVLVKTGLVVQVSPAWRTLSGRRGAAQYKLVQQAGLRPCTPPASSGDEEREVGEGSEVALGPESGPGRVSPVSSTKPWLQRGISRATWYRRKAEGGGGGSEATRVEGGAPASCYEEGGGMIEASFTCRVRYRPVVRADRIGPPVDSLDGGCRAARRC